ncbi:uncharacterized protein isoform X3 [Rhodnius prolixus]|uniref:uncharacterized protein isoform X3 n=1 Tax=Rhodnius prolixus TaxID=13249 RepID=UPI003D18E95C
MRMLHSISTPFAASITFYRFGKKMPGIPQLKTCCCCFTTETGSKIIGWLETIFGIIGVIIGALSFNDETKKYVNIGNAGSAVEAVSLVSSCITIILGIFLIVSIYMENMSYVRLWVFMSIIVLVINLVLYITRIILELQGVTENRGAVVGGQVIGLIVTFSTTLAERVEARHAKLRCVVILGSIPRSRPWILCNGLSEK